MAATKKLTALFPLFSLLCFISIFFLLLLFIRASIFPPPKQFRVFQIASNGSYGVNNVGSGSGCDYSDGSWIYAQMPDSREIVKWRWIPRNFPLPQLDPLKFLETYRDTDIGFIGDSLNRIMFVSLFCTLKRVSSEVKKWRPAVADRGFTFLQYNLTIAYHRTNLLKLLDSKRVIELDVDVPEGTWAKAPSFHDILIFNTGHWWFAPSKFDPVKSPMLFFENNLPVIPPIPPDVGLVKALKNMGQLNFFARNHLGILKEVTRTKVVLANSYDLCCQSKLKNSSHERITGQIADAHPVTAGGKKHNDCMHWWLPGIKDTWNDLFVTHLNDLKIRN
ncbi:hypothetical protein SLA2020_159120 [Shorea laevis]